MTFVLLHALLCIDHCSLGICLSQHLSHVVHTLSTLVISFEYISVLLIYQSDRACKHVARVITEQYEHRPLKHSMRDTVISINQAQRASRKKGKLRRQVEATNVICYNVSSKNNEKRRATCA